MSEDAYQVALAAIKDARQRRFVEEYTVDLNASGAARRAGYSERTARQQGHKLLTKSDIRRAVDARLAALTMTADEALYRLAEHARGTLAPFLVDDETRPGKVRIDISTPDAKRAIGLVREVTIKSDVTHVTGDEVTTRETVTVKLHDAQAALVKILQAYDRVRGDGEVNVTVPIMFYVPDNGRCDGSDD